jgi:hypothetical protein
MKRVSIIWIVLIQWAISFEWLHSGWGKWFGPGFMDNIGKTLAGFAAKNPYPGFANFLTTTAIPNAQVFGQVIRTGEIAVGIALLLSGIIWLTQKSHPVWASWLVALAFFGAALMNLNFFIASGWTSPSTWGINILMLALEIILGIFYITNRREFADRTLIVTK